MSTVLSDTDVRAMVRLVGEVAALDGDHAAKKRFLMDGLCGLIRAEAWVWTLTCQMAPNTVPTYVGFTRGGFSDERFARYLKALEHPDLARLTAPLARELQTHRTHLTRLLEQIDTTGGFATSGVYPLWKDADLGSVIASYRPLDDQCLSAIGIYRKNDDVSFTERESKMAHVILSEVPWLHETGWPEDRGVTVPRLYPQQRIVLNLLLQGGDRKSIASQLGISPNTVSGYVKEIYQHFKVNSQPELMRKFFNGDGGDAVKRSRNPAAN